VFPDPVAVSEVLGGVRYVNLPTLIDLKLASGITQPGRRKDLGDVQELARELRLDATFAERLHPFGREMYVTLVRELEAPDPQRDE
jgi:hypothetical protein